MHYQKCPFTPTVPTVLNYYYALQHTMRTIDKVRTFLSIWDCKALIPKLRISTQNHGTLLKKRSAIG